MVPGIKHAINPYCYRCPLKITYPACDIACAQDVEDVIHTTTCGRVAGMLVEPIQGVGGFITPPPSRLGLLNFTALVCPWLTPPWRNLTYCPLYVNHFAETNRPCCLPGYFDFSSSRDSPSSSIQVRSESLTPLR
jgi:hypothetical protein